LLVVDELARSCAAACNSGSFISALLFLTQENDKKEKPGREEIDKQGASHKGRAGETVCGPGGLTGGKGFRERADG